MVILWKGTVSAEFRANRPKTQRKLCFPQNFHTRKLGEITVFNTVFNSDVILITLSNDLIFYIVFCLLISNTSCSIPSPQFRIWLFQPPRYATGYRIRDHSTSMKLTLSWWGGLSTKKFQQSLSTRRAQLSVAATTVRSTDLLNCNVKTWVNTVYTRIERPSLVKAPLSV